jgi:hypothetical protein
LWNESYWYDATINSHNLCEGPDRPDITATDLCSGSNINIRYLLFLDLDGDGNMETVINSANLPGFNTVYFGNAANPNFPAAIRASSMSARYWPTRNTALPCKRP